jgi:hypothetical protein
VRMTATSCSFAVVCGALIGAASVSAQQIPLTDASRLQLRNARTEMVPHHGLPALKVTQQDAGPADGLVLVNGVHFRSGTIEVDVSGTPSAAASQTARGFIGIVFRVQGDGSRYESFYLRPTNGRADDQTRRNHSTQYVSAPDWPWDRLRKESPGVYESYADMQPGEWIHMRVAVRGTDASLYVGGADQPCLIVHDLKLGDTEGGVGLWIGPGTEGYFRDLKISTTGSQPRQ